MKSIHRSENGGDLQVVYLIVVYDMNESRTQLPRNLLRQYLTHVQNSVFEGEVTKGEADTIRSELQQLTYVDESVIVYEVSSESYVERDVSGEDPTTDVQFL